MAGGPCRYFTGSIRPRHLVGYFLVLGFMFCFCVVLGNKNELVFALLSGGLFYMVNAIRPRLKLLATVGIMLLGCIGFIDYARGFAADEITSKVSTDEIAFSLLQHCQ